MRDDYKGFVNSLRDMLSKRFTDLEVSVCEVTKNNGVVRPDLVAGKNHGNQSISIAIDSFYSEYMNGERMDLICDTVFELLVRHLALTGPQFTDFGRISDRIFLRLVNADKNEKALQNMPHRLYHDLAVTYYIQIGDETSHHATVTITNDFLSIWNMSETDLYELAMKNTQEHYRSEIDSMEGLRKEMMGNSYVCSEDIFGTEENPLESMYIVSNSMRWFGASVILYDKVLEEIADRLQNDFYILPSSVHELLVVPVTVDTPSEELIQLMRKVNRNEVEEDALLSDNIYLYHIEDKFMEMIGCDY